MSEKVSTMLMFHGDAYDAMQLYVSLFDDAKIIHIDRYGVGQAGPAGTIKSAQFELMGQRFLCIDSPVEASFTFTPSMSIFVDFKHADDLKRAHMKLTHQGRELMALGHHGFSTLFAWVTDRFGVSWQLNLK